MLTVLWSTVDALYTNALRKNMPSIAMTSAIPLLGPTNFANNSSVPILFLSLQFLCEVLV